MTVVASGDYGKPRPALIVQADAYADHPSLTVLSLTSDLHDMPLLRVTVEPGENAGLRLRSQVMVDKATTIPRAKRGHPGVCQPGLGCVPGHGVISALVHLKRTAEVPRMRGHSTRN